MPQFTDARFMTAADKRSVLAQWTRFLRALDRSYGDKARCFRAFPDALYTHLIQHCSFIAHYNRLGFFQTYFEEPAATARFLRQFDAAANPEGQSAEYGESWWLAGDYADLNAAMREEAAPFLPAILGNSQSRAA
jgi:hypothetical protein